jgi:hypothetical protein
MRSSGFSAAEKSAVTAACQHLIDDFLKPRFLPTIQPTQFNYPVDILGKWHGTKYRFIQRYRSGFPENLGEEFDAPFARLDWISRNRFDLQWHRHTGEWFCLHRSLTLAEAHSPIATSSSSRVSMMNAPGYFRISLTASDEMVERALA